MYFQFPIKTKYEYFAISTFQKAIFEFPVVYIEDKIEERWMSMH